MLMICEGCYYKYEGNVYFVTEPICSNGMSRVFKCEQIDDASKTDYHIVGESFLMPRDELYDAANLCEKCFTCRYVVESLRVIRCTLHGKIENEPYPKILPDCKFFSPLSSEPKPVKNPPGVEFKKLFNEVSRRNKPVYLNSLYYTMPPNVFGKLKTFLNGNELIYFGTGNSEMLGRPGVFCSHERIDEYLNYLGSERNFVCYRACDISEETYEKISTDLTDAELTYCALCVPSISFACFGDDYSVSYDCGNGYVVFANPKIAEALKAENDRTDWKKYIYYLQTN